MSWSKEIPKKEGHYWVKGEGIIIKKEYIHPVRLYKSNKSKRKPDTIFSEGENFSLRSQLFKEWWSEPINVPDGKETVMKSRTFDNVLEAWHTAELNRVSEGRYGLGDFAMKQAFEMLHDRKKQYKRDFKEEKHA